MMVRSEREILERLAEIKRKQAPKWTFAYNSERLWGYRDALGWVLGKR